MEFQECPLCASSKIQQRKGRYEFVIKGKKVKTPMIRYWKCPNCGEAFFDHEANRIIDEAFLKGRNPKTDLTTDQSRKIAEHKSSLANPHASL